MVSEDVDGGEGRGVGVEHKCFVVHHIGGNTPDQREIYS